jgi:hypothetical protein
MVCYSRHSLVEVTQLGHRPKINGLSFGIFLSNRVLVAGSSSTINP